MNDCTQATLRSPLSIKNGLPLGPLNIDWSKIPPDQRDLRDPQTLGEEHLANLTVQETPGTTDDSDSPLGWEGD